MPIAKFVAVRGVSSEDPVHCAENLVKQQPGKKWKTQRPGEKSAYVILEMDKGPHQITGIDIGNEHSAFVEVLVGRAGCNPEEFTEILITCSFMTPIESKNSTTINRVRCFNQDALVPTAAASDKWQLVKIICTQPFNTHVPYGIAFIKVHVAESKSSKTDASFSLVPEKFMNKIINASSAVDKPTGVPKKFSIGNYTLRESSPDSESETASGLFSRWKALRNNAASNNPPTTAAAIRDASSAAGLRRLSDNNNAKTLLPQSPLASEVKNTEKKAILDRNRDKLLFGDDFDDPTDNDPKVLRLMKHIEADQERVRFENENLKKQTETHKKKPPERARSKSKEKSPKLSESRSKHHKDSKDSSGKHRNDHREGKDSSEKQRSAHRDKSKENINKPSSKRHSSPHERTAKKVKTNIQYRPFNELLKDVTLVISGIQNPDRTDLRNKALSLGAKYKSDWDSSCTHLICAYKNTPKYQSVRGKGKIVTRKWIERCHSSKKYLPWRRYALDSAEVNQPESDEEILDESMRPPEEESIPSTSGSKKSSSLTVMDLTADIDVENDNCVQILSDTDTEDELDRIRKKNSTSNKENKGGALNQTADQIVYEISTEEEDYLPKKRGKIDIAKKFFKDEKFKIGPDISGVDRIKLEPYISQFGGILTDKLEDADYFINDTASVSNEKKEKLKGICVKPSWVYECNEMEAKVSVDPFLIT